MKWFRKKEIDAVQEQDAEIEGARGPSLVSGMRRVKNAGVGGMVAALILLCVLIFGGVWAFGQYAESLKPKTTGMQQTVGQTVPDIAMTRRPDLPEPPEAKPDPPPAPFNPIGSVMDSFVPMQSSSPEHQAPHQKTPEELLLEQRLSSRFAAGAVTGSAPPQTVGIGGERQDDAYSKMLRPSHTAMASARLLGDLDYIITKGTPISCTLDRRIVTTQPGPVGCYVTAPVMSASGKVALMDAGSEVTGVYRGGLTQGQASIFVLWERVRNGRMVIDLDSSAAGAMGQAGLSGKVDNHFWERFGSTIMLSLISDFGQAVTSGTRGNGQSIQFGNTAGGAQDAAAEALKNSINIAPTLYKNEGERVNIILARDLDFSSVYKLEPR